MPAHSGLLQVCIALAKLTIHFDDRPIAVRVTGETLWLPPAPQCLVELNHGLQFATSGSSEFQFGVEQVAVGIQGIKKSVDSASVPHIRKP